MEAVGALLAFLSAVLALGFAILTLVKKPSVFINIIQGRFEREETLLIRVFIACWLIGMMGIWLV